MGVRNLYKIIKDFAPDAIQTIPISELDGWRVGIDISLMIYQWCSVGQARGIKNAQGKYINHIQGAFFRLTTLLSLGIIPVCIFDGAPPKIKGETLAKRKAQRDAGNGVRVPREVFIEVKKLLDLMGVKTVQAPSEAEAQAAYYTTIDVLDAVGTEDADALTFGARYMIRGLDAAAKTVTVIEYAKVLKGLEFSRDQFIDLCILLGCDYTRTIPGIGYKLAVTLIDKHKSIEQILEKEKINRPENFEFEVARAEFKKPHVSLEKIDPDPKVLTSDDINQLKDFLITTHGLEMKRTSRTLAKLAPTS